jgi:hypothetical protein
VAVAVAVADGTVPSLPLVGAEALAAAMAGRAIVGPEALAAESEQPDRREAPATLSLM